MNRRCSKGLLRGASVILGVIIVGSFTNQTSARAEPQRGNGVIEVCKQIAPGGELGDVYLFTISGSAGFFDKERVTIGRCSPAVIVPRGLITVVETGGNIAVASITVTSMPPPATRRANLGNGSPNQCVSQLKPLSVTLACACTLQCSATLKASAGKFLRIWHRRWDRAKKPAAEPPSTTNAKTSASAPVVG